MTPLAAPATPDLIVIGTTGMADADFTLMIASAEQFLARSGSDAPAVSAAAIAEQARVLRTGEHVIVRRDPDYVKCGSGAHWIDGD